MDDQKQAHRSLTPVRSYLADSGEDPIDYLIELMRGDAPRPVRVGDSLYFLTDDILRHRARLRRDAAAAAVAVIAEASDG